MMAESSGKAEEEFIEFDADNGTIVTRTKDGKYKKYYGIEIVSIDFDYVESNKTADNKK